jgi:hypothetical protein
MIMTDSCTDPGTLVLHEEALPHIATVPIPAERIVEPPTSTRAVEQVPNFLFSSLNRYAFFVSSHDHDSACQTRIVQHEY